MQTFKIRQDGVKQLKNQMLLRTIPLMLIAATAGIVVSTINAKDKADDSNVLSFVIPLVVLSVGVGMYRGVNRQKALLNSYTLTITDNLITREQRNTPTISIYVNNIATITKHKNGSFTVKGKDATDRIIIPSQIDNYPQLETMLQSMQSIAVQQNRPFFQKYSALTGLVGLGLLLCVYSANNKVTVAVAGTILVALITGSFIAIRKSKNVDAKTKKMAWWMLLVLASVIAVMMLKVTGHTAM